MNAEIQVFLVVPCFHESGRIAILLRDLAATFADTDPIRILLVEDGSGGEEQERFLKVVMPLMEGRALFEPPLLLPENLGKGGAVYAGWARHSGQAWLAFVDADGSCSAREVKRLIEIASSVASLVPGQLAFFASRIKMLGRRIERRLKRHIVGRLYATLVSEYHGVDVYDSQCGLKLIPLQVWETLRPCLEQRGFAFDVELLMALTDAGVMVREVPIDWHEVPGGKVHLVRDSFRMFREVLAIKRHRSSPIWRRTIARLHAQGQEDQA